MCNFFPPGSGYGSRDPIESGSNPDTDPDQQHCIVSIPVVVSSLICWNEKMCQQGTVIVTVLLKAKNWILYYSKKKNIFSWRLEVE
jgi:hypothetical protein